MPLVQIIVAGVILGLSIAFIYISDRSAKKVKSVADFLSFGQANVKKLERAFESSNASFLTSFVSLFSFSLLLGWSSFWIPIGFCIGILVFNYFFLKRMMPYLIRGIKYPRVIGDICGSNRIRIFVAIFSVINIWLFTFSELQGFHLFVVSFFNNSGIVSYLFPLFLVIVVALYTSKGGYRAVVDTDTLQMTFIYLLVLSVVFFLIKNLYLANIEISKIEVTSFITSNTIPFAISTIFGFLFSQILYYDNWQRLAYFLVNKAKMDGVEITNINKLESHSFFLDGVSKIRKAYNIGAIALIIIYSVPIVLGNLSYSAGIVDENLNSISQLASLFSSMNVDFNTLSGILNLLILVSLFLGFFSALISTTDTYIIAITSLLTEDILQTFKEEDRFQTDSVNSKASLSALRIITIIVSLSLYPLLYVETDFTNLFPFIFYSVNGLVGPVVLILLGRKVSSYSVLLSSLFCFAYTYLFIYKHALDTFLDNTILESILSPGTFNIIFSLIISYVGSSKSLNNHIYGTTS